MSKQAEWHMTNARDLLDEARGRVLAHCPRGLGPMGVKECEAVYDLVESAQKAVVSAMRASKRDCEDRPHILIQLTDSALTQAAIDVAVRASAFGHSRYEGEWPQKEGE